MTSTKAKRSASTEEELARMLKAIRARSEALVAYVDDVETRLLAFCVVCAATGSECADDEMVTGALELLARDGNTLHTRDAARAELERRTK